MPRFEVGEEVIIKNKHGRRGEGRINRILTNMWPARFPLIYYVETSHSIPKYAADIKDRCLYARGFPIYRIYKLGEA